MYIELVAQLLLIHYHKWVVQQVKMCIKDYTYKTLTSFGCLQFIITLWLPFCNINNDQKEEAGSVTQSRFVQCSDDWSSIFILTATHHLLSLMLHAGEGKNTLLWTVILVYFLLELSWLSLLYWWQVYYGDFFPPQMRSLAQVLLKRHWEVSCSCVLDNIPCKGWRFLQCDLVWDL